MRKDQSDWIDLIGDSMGFFALPRGRVRRRSQPRRGVRTKRGRVSLMDVRPNSSKDPLQSPIRFTAGASFPQGKPFFALPWGRVGVAGVRVNSIRAGLLRSTPALKARVGGPRAGF